MTTVAPETFETMNDAFKTGTDTFATFVQTGVKFQEQTARFWNDLFARSNDEIRTQTERFNRDIMPVARRNAERVQKLVDEQTQRTTDFVRRSFDIGQAATPAEAMDKFLGLWQTSFDVMKQSTDAFARVGNEMVANWSDSMKNCCQFAAKPGVNVAGKGNAGKKD
ncbi:hypothetical protein RAS1_34470 [Phycisphaerae bacterium RAS1]|nr:hypothetical protein RAS1_34470 [Phycisphaerae bacterium RAS1]